MLAKILLAIAARFHSHKDHDFDLWVNERIFTPEGNLTNRFSARTCRICGERQEFEYNTRQFNYVKVGEVDEYCELCGSRELVSRAPASLRAATNSWGPAG